ncbi:MAG: PKD domain-containing protein, partial [Bacteroidia bacterium]
GLANSQIIKKVVGVAPNRSCIIQWSNFSRYPYDEYTKDTFNFQIVLKENSSVEIFYGAPFTFDTARAGGDPIQVGITGDVTTDFNSRSGNSFVASSAATSNTAGIAASTTNVPVSGLNYRWRQPVMDLVSTTAVQVSDSVERGTYNEGIINVKVTTSGGLNPLPITALTFNANGTTDIADIARARVYYTGKSLNLYAATAAQLFDSFAVNVSGNFTFRDTILLNTGENNFWLVYDITDSAKLDNVVDAEFVSSVINGVPRTPLVTSPPNSRLIVKNDIQKLDTADCEDDDNVQLKLMRPDATGLGMAGKECPGPEGDFSHGIEFKIGAVEGVLGQYPGISPDCGASWIRFNHDSMADRRDATPCVLDGFVNYTGALGPAPQAGGTQSVTPGGLVRPPFAINQNYRDIGNNPGRWNDPAGTSFWYHYGTNTFPLQAIGSYNLFPPANPTGDITIGLIIGTGDPNNPCISDTVWYHNFLNITDLDGRFYVDPVYHPITNIPTNGDCKYYCKNDVVNFVYLDSTQAYIHSSTIDWGDNVKTIDSFYYSIKPGLTDGYFVNGFRRVRYNYFYGNCGENLSGVLLDSIPFPNGLPDVNVTVKHFDNFSMRFYDPVNNPYGSLRKIGRVTTNDSTIWEECLKQFTIADKDTIATFYRTEVYDPAKMLLPVKHQYWLSSYEAACKLGGSAPRPVKHLLISTKECMVEEFDDKLLVRGVIDSVMTRDAKGNFDNVFCKNEPVHFYDSIRYYRGDCSISDPVFNKNGTPIIDPVTCKVSRGAVYLNPFDSYHYDTVDYWRGGAVNPNNFYPCGAYVEKVKYYFGDGDSAMWTNPVHKYKQAGAYTVTMLSRDKNGCWDTAQCIVYISEPNAIPVIKPGTYNCGSPVTFFDRSTMTPMPGYPNNPFDSIRFEPNVGSSGLVNRNYWYFGERKPPSDTLLSDAQFIDTAVWNYRGNGKFKIRLVVETAQGCKDSNWVDLNILGPRPHFNLLSPATGCAPFTVKVVNLADVFGAIGPTDKPTKRTDILWGDANQQSSVSLNQYDTLTFTYNDSGTFYIFARSDDNNPQSDNNGCKIVNYPDTVGGINAPIMVNVKRSYPAEIEIDKQVVCVDQPFTVTNKSDTISYTEFKYEMFDEDGQVLVDSIIKNNIDNKFTYTFADTGNYSVRLTPTQVAPGLPFCRLFDTLPVKVVRPFASFTIDSADVPVFKFKNTSVSSNEYTWTATKNGNLVSQVDKVESDKDWSFDFGTDTGDVVICLQAFTQDPAKPDCMDSVCQTISYRFVIDLEIYNVFTPNTSPGVNDFFDIKIKGETAYDLVIYNRWGTKVFESTNSSYDWNGTNMNDGSDCP